MTTFKCKYCKTLLLLVEDARTAYYRCPRCEATGPKVSHGGGLTEAGKAMLAARMVGKFAKPPLESGQLRDQLQQLTGEYCRYKSLWLPDAEKRCREAKVCLQEVLRKTTRVSYSSCLAAARLADLQRATGQLQASVVERKKLLDRFAALRESIFNTRARLRKVVLKEQGEAEKEARKQAIRRRRSQNERPHR